MAIGRFTEIAEIFAQFEQEQGRKPNAAERALVFSTLGVDDLVRNNAIANGDMENDE